MTESKRRESQRRQEEFRQSSQREVSEWTQGTSYARIDKCWEFFTTDLLIQPSYPVGLKVQKRMNTKKPTPRHIMMKVYDTKGKKKKKKCVAREKSQFT